MGGSAGTPGALIRLVLLLGACLGVAALSACAFGEPKPTTDLTLTGATLHNRITNNAPSDDDPSWSPLPPAATLR